MNVKFVYIVVDLKFIILWVEFDKYIDIIITKPNLLENEIDSQIEFWREKENGYMEFRSSNFQESKIRMAKARQSNSAA